MKAFFVKTSVLLGVLLALPAAGALMSGQPFSRYLEFPPIERYVTHAPFSWCAFIIIGFSTLSFILIPIIGCRGGVRCPGGMRDERLIFPWWGRLGVLTGAISWILAWTRFQWFEDLQVHTFIPLWLSYIVVINASSYRRKGGCMMLDRKLYFFLLFPLSALFWWFFEYLNRFVQNWIYTGVYLDAFEYFLYSTLSFSTVLPAVLSTREWLNTFPFIGRKFKNCSAVKVWKPKYAAGFAIVVSGAGLALIGVWPDYLFPLLWISPLLLIVSLQVIEEKKHIFSYLVNGDWTLVITSALAALFCGFFWELWNTWSLAKWEYAIPLVQRFELFEMPLLGYAGYLPFGLECAVAGDILENLIKAPSRV